MTPTKPKGEAYGEEREEGGSGQERREVTPFPEERATQERLEEVEKTKPPPVVVHLEPLELKGEGV